MSGARLLESKEFAAGGVAGGRRGAGSGRRRGAVALLGLALCLLAVPAPAAESGEGTLVAPGFAVDYRQCDGTAAPVERLTLPSPLGSRYKGMHALLRARIEKGRPVGIELLHGDAPLLEALRWHVERARFAVGQDACVEMAYRVTGTVLKAEDVIRFRVWLEATLAPDGRVEQASVVEEIGSAAVAREIERQVLSFAAEPARTEAGPARATTSLRVEVTLVPDGWRSYLVTTRLVRRGARPVEVTSPPFPRHLGSLASRGRVLLEFMVAPDGRPVETRVVRARPRGVFEAAALATLGRWRFRPDRVDGEPVPTGPVRQVIMFDPGRAPAGPPALPADLAVSRSGRGDAPPP